MIKKGQDMTCCRIFTFVTLLCAVGRAAGPTTAPAAPGIEESLDRRLAEVRFDNLPLDKALDTFGEQLKANIVVNWAAMHKAGVEPTTPINLHLTNVTFRQALAVVIALIGDGGPEISYQTDENVLTITHLRFDPPPRNPVKIYDVHDLLDAAVARRQAAPPAPNSNPQSQDVEAEEAEELCKLIVGTVDSDLWTNFNGQGARIWLGRLVVSNSPAVQEHVAEFLAKLRQALPAAKSGDGK
jgi:hypothetical protein